MAPIGTVGASGGGTMDDDHVRLCLVAFMRQRGLNVERWTTKAGISPNTLRTYLANPDGGRSITLKILNKLAKSENVTIYDLLDTVPSESLPIRKVLVLHDEKIMRFIREGSVPSGQMMDSVSVSYEHGHLFGYKCCDDAMYKTCPKGSVAIIDFTSCDLRSCKIYLFHHDDKYIIRRYRSDDSHIWLDGDAGDPIFFSDDIRVIGRVVSVQTMFD